MSQPPLLGAFCKNGKKIGDVLAAVPLAAPEAKATDQAAPAVTKERFQLTVSGNLLVSGTDNAGNVYEVASKAARLRVYPQSCQAARTMTKILVDLAP